MSRPDSDEATEFLFSEATSVVGGLCAVVISFVGSLANLYTVVALSLSPLRSHPTTIALLSLASSDLLFSIYILPVESHRLFHRGCEFMCLHPDHCDYVPFFYYGTIGVSLWTMALIAVQRVVGVWHGPAHINLCARLPMLGWVIMVWILSFGSLYLPLTKTWGQFGFEPQSYSCTIVASSGHSFLPVVAGLGVALPLITIAGSYSAIYCRVVNTGRATRRAAGAGDLAGDLSIEAQTRARERSLTITFSLIFLSFVLCFLPYSCLTLLDPLPPSRLGWLHMLATVLTWTSAFLNPVIYCLANKYYLKAFLQLGRRLCGRDGHTPATHSDSSRQTEETGTHGVQLLPATKQQQNMKTDFAQLGTAGNLARLQD